MTAKEMMTVIGKLGVFEVQTGFQIEVEIKDVRKVFDRVDYRIRPLAGAGGAWVAANRVKLAEVM